MKMIITLFVTKLMEVSVHLINLIFSDRLNFYLQFVYLILSLKIQKRRYAGIVFVDEKEPNLKNLFENEAVQFYR